MRGGRGWGLSWVPEYQPQPGEANAQYSPEYVATKWVYALLAQAPAGITYSLYAGSVPVEADYPFVVWQLIPGIPDDLYGDGEAAIHEVLIQLKAVTDTNDESLASRIATACQNTLHNSRTENFHGYQMNCVRREGSMIPTFDSKQYRQSGGRYAVTARPLG